MGRFMDFLPSTKVPTSGGTTSFTSAEVPGTGVVAYVVALTGTNNLLSALSRIRVRAGGPSIIDADISHFRTYIQRQAQSHESPATTDARIIIPLTFNDPYLTEDMQDLCQFPAGLAPTVELVYGTFTVATDTVQIGWIKSDVTPTHYQSYVTNVLNFSASTNNNTYPITQKGLIAGYSINTTGLSRLKLVAGGVQVHQYSATLGIESQIMNDLDTLTNPMFRRIYPSRQALPSGTSYAEVDAGAAWAGVANEIGIMTYIPQGQ